VQFGDMYKREIADIISKYSKYNGRRKPELLDANTYSVGNYDEEGNGEFGTIVKEYNGLLATAEKINNKLPSEYRDAFFQLVLHPVRACANLNEMYYNVALNREAYKRKYLSANDYADKVKQFYTNDSLTTRQYHQLNNGKWNHMMDQTHIGYTYWQQPPRQKMPDVKYISKDSAIKEALKYNSLVGSASIPPDANPNSFFEIARYISIEAVNFSKAVNTNGIIWKILPDHGRTGDAITTFPVTSPIQKISAGSAHLEYEIYTDSRDSLKINAYFSPTLNYYNTEDGLQYAISMDDEAPQKISINKEDRNTGAGIWNKWVGENIIIKTSRHKISQPGKHIVKYWVVDPGVVLQKLVLDFGGLEPSYLGPTETRTIK